MRLKGRAKRGFSLIEVDGEKSEVERDVEERRDDLVRDRGRGTKLSGGR